ncbi:hypothetical protein HAHE_10250 [Haloferula helveola]|uniref:histidine kinase n=1 Tax=Haloferula helveola TaxID=490095 RepID=A0ABM7RE19_9BACT|nr:hypothetical protein HAHE_10250 [Haloferula helveola]
MLRMRASALFVAGCVCIPNLNGETSGENESSIGLFQLGRTLRSWSIDDGLPGNSCTTIAQTPDGYLWLGSNAGLTQFNGTRFKSFNTDNHPDIEHNDFPFLVLAENGELWAMNPRLQTLMLRDGEFVSLQWPDRPRGNLQGACAAPGSGVFATNMFDNESVLLHLTETSCEVLTDPQRRLANPLSLEADDGGAVWLVTRTRQLLRLEGRSFVPAGVPGPVGTTFRLLDGTLALVDRSGVLRYEDGKWVRHLSFRSELPSPWRINQCCQDGDGNYWIAIPSEGIWLARPDGTCHRLITHPKRLDAARAIFRDRDGSVWIGNRPGLSQALRTPFTSVPVVDPSAPPLITSISEDGEGTLWFGASGGLYRLTRESGQLEKAGDFPLSPSVMVEGRKPEGAWVADVSSRSFYEVDRSGEVRYLPELEKLTDRNQPTGMAADDGGFWFSTLSGLFRYSATDGGQAVPLPPIKNKPVMKGVFRGPNDDIHVIASGFGFLRRDDSGWKRVRGRPGEGATYDDAGRLWVIHGFQKQIGCTDADGHRLRDLGGTLLGEGALTGIVSDRHGGLWFTTPYSGVFRVEADALYRFVCREADCPEVVRFDRNDGLASRACSWMQTGVFLSSDDRIWVGTAEGPSVIHPEDSLLREKETSTFPVHLEQVRVDGSEQFVGVSGNDRGPGQLPASANRMTFEYSSLDFGSPRFIGFRHRIRGLDDTWSAVSSDPTAVYQNLPPGNYRFEVEGVSRGQLAAASAGWKFNIAPAWWQRRGIRLAAVMIVALMLYGFYAWRIRAFRRRQAEQAAFSRQLIDSQEGERKRIAGELHDSLGQHLLLIKNSAELARRKLDSESPVRERLAEVTEIAGDAIQEVRDITRDLRPTALDRLGLRVATRSMIERVTEHSSVGVSHELEGLDADWTEHQRIAIFRLIQEALNNALRHAEANRIHVVARAPSDTLHLEIADDGKGFVPGSIQSGGLGLTGMRERTTLLSGSFRVVSSPGHGTRILIDIPLPAAKS